jgi:SAM-dependent methyltransferase
LLIPMLVAKARRLARRPGATRLGYNRLCHREDFDTPALRRVIRDVFPHEIARFGPDFPSGREYRKYWEVAMAVRTLADFGALHDRSRVLGVGAGNEPTIFALTNRVGRVFATDLYLQGGDWRESAHASMLVEPGRHWPSPWNPRRLVVQHMNGLDLQYEDASFDAIFSSSSIEHFGTAADVRRAVAELHRVLKPGGILSLSTEFRLAGPPPGLPGALLFDEADVRSILIGGLAWDPVDPADFTLSDATLGTAVPFGEALEDVSRHVETHGCLVFHRLDWRRYPHIVLREGEWLWTSLHLALRKQSVQNGSATRSR